MHKHLVSFPDPLGVSNFIVLVILDGWGAAPDGPGNAISRASTPVFDGLISRWPSSTLEASGPAVGLPDGQMGNSEVGHMTIGAGRILLQPLTRMNEAVRSGVLDDNDAVARAMDVPEGSSLHLMAMLSDGGVHSHQEHLFHMLGLARRRGIEPWVHVMLDGRDTPPRSAGTYFEALGRAIAEHGGRIATIAGRYYAMDRDNRWDRTRLEYDAVVSAEGASRSGWEDTLGSSYADGKGDEFVVPVVIDGYHGLNGGDSVIMVNFRPDRIRQISEALTSPSFDGFEREPPDIRYTMMMEVSDGTVGDIVLPPIPVAGTLGEVVSLHGTQLRLAETEKYAHVTFFLNDGRREPYPGEDRVLIPSPGVATYDLKPEMCAGEVADALVERLDPGHMLIVVNFANPDMVGHTGDMKATIAAVEAVDACLGRVHRAVEERGGRLVIIADHGNAEQMLDDGDVRTAHSLNRVPCIITGVDGRLDDGGLRDVAPTVLTLLGLEIPEGMTGRSLLHR